MYPLLTSIDPTASAAHIKRILAQDGFKCSIIELESGEEAPAREAHEVEQQLLFAIDGEVTVRFGDLNTVLRTDAALLVPKGIAYQLVASATRRAKILRVDIPPRQLLTPQILTVDR